MRKSLVFAGVAVMALSGCDPTYTETKFIDGVPVSIYANHFLVTSYYVRWGEEYIYCGSEPEDCIETLKLLETGDYDTETGGPGGGDPGSDRDEGGDAPEGRDD